MLADKVYYSNRLIHLLGYSADEFSDTQEEFWSRLHPDDYEETRQALDRHLEEREPFVLDFRIRTKSGEYRWFHNRGQALWDKTGKATRMSGSVTDITPRKKVEEAILRSEERFRSLLEQSPMPMEILSVDGKILHSNPSWNKLWGVDAAAAAEVMEKYNMLTDPKLKRLGIDHLVEKAFSGEHIILPPIIYDAYETVEDFEIEKLSGLKSPWIQCHLYPIKDKNDTVVNIINTYIDISDLKNTEAELRSAYEEIKHLKEQLEAESAYLQDEIKLDIILKISSGRAKH